MQALVSLTFVRVYVFCFVIATMVIAVGLSLIMPPASPSSASLDGFAANKKTRQLSEALGLLRRSLPGVPCVHLEHIKKGVAASFKTRDCALL
jgi:hypothetical protein